MDRHSSILVDTIPLVPGSTSVGVKVYITELLDAIPHSRRPSIRLVCTRSNASLFRELEGYPMTVLPWTVGRRPVRVFTQQVAIPWLARRFHVDVLFEPIDSAAILAPVPTVTCLHSSHLNLHHDQMGGLRAWYNRGVLRLSVQRSTRLIAISDYVRQSVIQLLGASPECIDVVYHGGGVVERAQRNGRYPREATPQGEPGILFVSTLYPHKNADRLIRAYADLCSRRQHVPPLYIVGANTDGERPCEQGGGEQQRLQQLAAHLGVGADVHFLGRISNDALLDRFSFSALMVYPSSIEGFGLPALEAMQAGLPLVASNKTSVPEIVGEGGLTVDPMDTQALSKAMEQALFDTTTRTHLKEAGHRRGRQFSWERTAHETLCVLDKAASRHA